MTLNTVLVIDDSEAEQFLYKHMIESHDKDAKVLSAYDGEEALEVLTNGKEEPSCILLDINMPRMNGFEFLDSYSKQFKGEHAIIVMLTSSTHTDDKERALAYQYVRDYFIKPITAEDLQKLSAIVKKS